MTQDEIRALVLKAHEAFVAGNAAALESALAPDCVLHQCGFLDPLSGDQIRSFVEGTGRALSDRRSWVDNVVVEGNSAAVRWTTAGRHTGSLVPEATGREVTFSSMTFVRVEHGKIAEIWNIQDTASLRTQLEQPNLQ